MQRTKRLFLRANALEEPNHPVKILFTRHSERDDLDRTGLSWGGVVEAIKRGERLAEKNKGAKFKLYTSPELRTDSTSQVRQLGYVGKGRIYSKIRQRKELGVPVVDEKEWRKSLILDYHYDGEAMTRDWFRGKTGPKVFIPWRYYIDELIRKRSRVGARIAISGARRRVLIENIVHQASLLALVARLTGKNPLKLMKQNHINFNESVELTVFHNKKAILRFREKKFDVTKRYWKIINYTL